MGLLAEEVSNRELHGPGLSIFFLSIHPAFCPLSPLSLEARIRL